MNIGLVLMSGLLLGFAGSFHCAAYCGAIASSLALATPASSNGRASMAWHVFAPHLGRLSMYTAFGFAAGATISSVVSLTELSGLRVASVTLASVSLIWSATASMGWIPERAGPSRILAHLVSRRAIVGQGRALLPLGFAWGCTPCGMVYAALLSASLTGSSLAGAIFMLGFGAATLPPLLLVGIGQLAFRRHRFAGESARPLKHLAGALLMLTAIVNLFMIGAGPLAQFCAGQP